MSELNQIHDFKDQVAFKDFKDRLKSLLLKTLCVRSFTISVNLPLHSTSLFPTHTFNGLAALGDVCSFLTIPESK